MSLLQELLTYKTNGLVLMESVLYSIDVPNSGVLLTGAPLYTTTYYGVPVLVSWPLTDLSQ